MNNRILIFLVTNLLSFSLVYLFADKVVLPLYLFTSEVEVPKIINQNISEAINNLDKLDLNYNIQLVPSKRNEEIDKVIHISPDEGKIVKKQTVVDIKAYGPRESYNVPNLINKSKSVALNMLRSMSIKLDTVIYDYNDVICTNLSLPSNEIDINNLYQMCEEYPENIVWKQIPSSNQKYFKDDLITLFVSKGKFAPEFYEVPILIGKHIDDALNLINKSGLILGKISYSDGGYKKNNVIDQSQYGKCRINDKINLIIQK